MFRLCNPVKTYAWGDSSFIQDLLGLDQSPIAEVWMGAHPADPSRIRIGAEEQPLDEYLRGTHQDLPFLFKVLAAGSPLSIQVHPSKSMAREGFARENRIGIAPDDPKRNYKDDNHKPEMLLALTEFEALCGFRDFAEISLFLQHFALDEPLPAAASFIWNPSAAALSGLIRSLLELNTPAQAGFVHRVLNREFSEQHRTPQAIELQSVCHRLNVCFPGDIGCLFPLFLNHLRLQPFEAIFISHSIPHAYLRGGGLELMASSDNVLRGALTPKHIDIEELIRVCSFEPQPIHRIESYQNSSDLLVYSPPVSEFELTFPLLADVDLAPAQSARIALCLAGSYTFSSAETSLDISKGESVFIAAGEEVRLKGDGCLAIAGTASTIKN
ncbi:MAG TPA: mannose-6-phosphate isomerase, class I [Candidatus Cloacimonadota bacterium]|nr:mannose-6-phosphate isomerase, class I [Candidatus Cloacimonadota bacterium]